MMRQIRLVAILVGCCLLATFYTPPPAQAATAKVQSCNTKVNTSDTTITCTFASSVTVGNLVICAASAATNTVTITPSDTATNGYTSQTSYDDTAGTLARLYNFYAKNIAGAFTVLTVTYSSAVTIRAVYCDEVSGADTTAPADGINGNYQASNGDTSTDAITSNTITPSASGDYLFGASIDSDQNCIALNAGTGWSGTPLTECNQIRQEYWPNKSGTSAQAATFTHPGGTTSFVTSIQAFKAATSVDTTKFRLRINQ